VKKRSAFIATKYTICLFNCENVLFSERASNTLCHGKVKILADSTRIECSKRFGSLNPESGQKYCKVRPCGVPTVWSAIGVLAFCPILRSQSISSVRADAPMFVHPHSSISKVQSPEWPAAVCGAPINVVHKNYY